MKRVQLTRAVALAFAALLLGSCGLVLDDYTLDTTLLDDGSCEQGQFRCSADWLTTCDPSTLKGWIQTAKCETAALCNGKVGRCDVCRGGEYRCVGGKLETCTSDRTGFEFVQDCGSAEQCNVNLAQCGSCVPGNYQCNQGALSVCTTGSSWGTPMQCSPPDRCSVSPDRKTGECTAQACNKEAYSCQGAQLVRCDKDGTVPQPIELCASPALCTQASMGSGIVACPQPACELNSFNCNGSMLQKCNADRTAFVDVMPCNADSPCNPTGTCGKCTENSVHCQGAALLRCNASGVFEKQQDCATPGLCDPVEGVCQPPTCDNPGEGMCESGSGRLLVCSNDLKWEQKYFCDSHALCNAADRRCETPLCEAGAKRCDQNRLQECNPELTGWRSADPCPQGSQCDLLAESGCSASCSEGKYRCNDVFLETCKTGTWTRIDRCQSTKLCSVTAQQDGGECLAPECKEGELRCVNQDLQRCRPDLTWETIRSCEGTTQCDATTSTCK